MRSIRREELGGDREYGGYDENEVSPVMELGVVFIGSNVRWVRMNLILPLLGLIWCVLAIELSLSGNAVSNVYTIDNTGQIIPFVNGSCTLAITLWTASKPKPSKEQKDDIEAQAGDKTNESEDDGQTHGNDADANVNPEDSTTNRPSTPEAK